MGQSLVQPGLILGLLFVYVGTGSLCDAHQSRLPGSASGLLINHHRVWRDSWRKEACVSAKHCYYRIKDPGSCPPPEVVMLSYR